MGCFCFCCFVFTSLLNISTVQCAPQSGHGSSRQQGVGSARYIARAGWPHRPSYRRPWFSLGGPTRPGPASAPGPIGSYSPDPAQPGPARLGQIRPDSAWFRPARPSDRPSRHLFIAFFLLIAVIIIIDAGAFGAHRFVVHLVEALAPHGRLAVLQQKAATSAYLKHLHTWSVSQAYTHTHTETVSLPCRQNTLDATGRSAPRCSSP